MYSFSQCCFVCISWGNSVFALGTQLRCALGNGYLIDWWLRTELGHLHQTQETAPQWPGFCPPSSLPSYRFLPSVYLPLWNCTMLFCTYAQKDPLVSNILLFFTVRQKQAHLTLTCWVRAFSVSTASLLPSLVFHNA